MRNAAANTVRATLISVIATILVTGCSATTQEFRAAPEGPACSLVRLALLDARVSDHVTIPVRFAEQQALMQFRVSAPFNFISEDTVARFKLRTHKLVGLNIQFGSERAKDYAQLDTLQLGNVILRHVSFIVIPRWYSGPGRIEAPEIGSLSMRALESLDVELDLAHNRIALYSADHCPGPTVYWADTAAKMSFRRGPMGNYYFPVELEGKKLEATISTNPTTSLAEAVSRKVYGFDRRSPDVKWMRIGGSTSEPYFMAMKVTTEGFYVTNANVLLRSTWDRCKVTLRKAPYEAVGFNGCINVYPLVLGLDVLKELRLYFATKESMLYLTSAKTQGEQSASGN